MKTYEIILQTKERLARSFYAKAYILTKSYKWNSIDKFDCANCAFNKDKAINIYNSLTREIISNDIPTASSEHIKLSVYEYDIETDSRGEVCTRYIGEEF